MQTSNSYFRFLEANLISMSGAEISNTNNIIFQWQLFNSPFNSLTDIRKVLYEKISLINISSYPKTQTFDLFFASIQVDIFLVNKKR